MAKRNAAVMPAYPLLPPIDPSENVKALNEASSRHLREVVRMEVEGLRREIENQATLVSKMRDIDRLNQRLIDERLEASTEKVSATIELTAKTLSATVNETAKTLASSHEANFNRLSERVAILERAQYQGAGQAGVRDPLIDSLMEEVRLLRAAQAAGGGLKAGLSLGASILIGAVGLIGAIIGILSFFAG